MTDEPHDSGEDAPLPLTAADLQKARAELAEWMDAREFRRRVHGFDKRTPSKELFNDNKYKFLREAALVLAELSKHKPFVQIRLAEVAERWPDGYARTETGEIRIEVTSAQDRPLGAEYKFEGPMQRDSVEPIERVKSIRAALEKAIRDKVEKQYPRCALVVDLNISNQGIKQAETEQAIADIKDKYGPEFQHIWILWKDRVF
jgi:hypothetical protein